MRWTEEQLKKINSKISLNVLFIMGLIAFIGGIIGTFVSHHELFLIFTVIGAMLALSVTWLRVWQEKR